jgi:predicted PurR-regulated permease PerM
MNFDDKRAAELQPGAASGLLDVLIRAGLIFVLAALCFQIFAPFLTLMVWALILAVTLYPMQEYVAAKLGGRQGLAATLIAILCSPVVLTDRILMSSLADSVQQLVHDVQNDALVIPAPRESVARWPVIARGLCTMVQAHADLPALVKSMQPKIGDLAKTALAFVASIGGGLLLFIAAFIIAAILMAFGQSGSRASVAISERLTGPARGAEFATLSTATIRAVAQGVIGVAFIQAIIVGLCLLIAGVPWAGVLAMICLVLGIAQIPALIVTLPAIAYIWLLGDYGKGEAILYTLLIFVAGLADNVLKPLMLAAGRRPMAVIHRRLGGMAAAGILDVRRCDTAGVG